MSWFDHPPFLTRLGGRPAVVLLKDISSKILLVINFILAIAVARKMRDVWKVVFPLPLQMGLVALEVLLLR